MKRKRGRPKKRLKRAKRGLKVSNDTITLTCYTCNLQKVVVRTEDAIDAALDREAAGWYTILDGIALCPRHAIESGTTLRPLYPLHETIYGDPEARREALDRFMERTRRRMERASWRSMTSDDSTT